MKNIKVLKKSVTFITKGEEYKVSDQGIMQGEISENFDYGLYYSSETGLNIVDIEKRECHLIKIPTGCDFYTFQKNSRLSLGVGIVLSHKECPENERFWTHQILISDYTLSERLNVWR